MLASLVVCFFTRGVCTPEAVLEALATAGFDRSEGDLAALGAETLSRKYDFKVREGFNPAKLRIPGRILETPSARGPIDESFLRQAVSAYADRVRDEGQQRCAQGHPLSPQPVQQARERSSDTCPKPPSASQQT